MKFKTCHGLLLKKTILANDDGLLEFFTSEEGVITVFVPKLGRSKKKKVDLDYFRVLLLELTEGRGATRLKSVSTLNYFNGIEQDYVLYEKACEWLLELKNLPYSNDETKTFFLEIIKFFGSLKSAEIVWFDAFFCLKILSYEGRIDRFDLIQKSVYLDCEYFMFYENFREKTIFITNEERQVLEFLRRSNTELFLEKISKLPPSALTKVQEVITHLK